jgi:hypothetical protein
MKKKKRTKEGSLNTSPLALSYTKQVRVTSKKMKAQLVFFVSDIMMSIKEIRLSQEQNVHNLKPSC